MLGTATITQGREKQWRDCLIILRSIRIQITKEDWWEEVDLRGLKNTKRIRSNRR